MNDPFADIRDAEGGLPAILFPYPVVYHDGDGSDLCADCANVSDQSADEVPQFRPIRYSLLEEDGDEDRLYCDACSLPIDPAIRVEEDVEVAS